MISRGSRGGGGGGGGVRLCSVWSALFLAICCLECVGIFSCSVANIVLNFFEQEPSDSSYFLSGLVMLTMLFMLYLAVESVLQENHFQLAAFYIANWALVARMLYGFTVLREYDRITFLIPGVLSLVCCAGYTAVLVPLVRSFGWRLFHAVGTNVAMIALFRNYTIFLTVAKLDVLLTLCVFVMGIFFVAFEWWISYAGLSTAVAANIATLVLCVRIGIRRESRPVCALYALFSCLMPVYLVYKSVNVWTTDNIRTISGSTLDSVSIKVLLTAVSAAAILWRIVGIAALAVVVSGFGKGLGHVLRGKRGSSSGGGGSGSNGDDGAVSGTGNDRVETPGGGGGPDDDTHSFDSLDDDDHHHHSGPGGASGGGGGVHHRYAEVSRLI